MDVGLSTLIASGGVIASIAMAYGVLKTSLSGLKDSVKTGFDRTEDSVKAVQAQVKSVDALVGAVDTKVDDVGDKVEKVARGVAVLGTVAPPNVRAMLKGF